MDVQQFIKHVFAYISNGSIPANACVINKIIDMGSIKCIMQNILQVRGKGTKAFYIAGIELECFGFLPALPYTRYYALCVLHLAIVCEDDINSSFCKA